MFEIKILEELSNAFGPSGFEEDVVRVIANHSDGFELSHDAMHNVILRHSENNENKATVMLDAHTDEVGFMVQAFLENGTIAMVSLGSIIATNIPAHTVIIRTRSGKKVRGITTSKAPHFMTAKERANTELEIESLTIDVGASSKEEVINEYGISVGDPIMLDVTFDFDEEHGICFGKAFDNRLGCAAILGTMKALQNENPSVNLVGAFAAQEEVGTRGAEVTRCLAKPDIAIVFEGSPADDLYYDIGIAQGALKKGAQIRNMDVGYISNPEFIEYAQKIGDKYGIPYQNTVRRGGSTNAAKISLAGKAVPVLVLGIPVRFVHSHYNHCAISDLEAVIQMATHVIRDLDDTSLQKILRQDLLS